jgi:dihydroorotate dehydrogenase
MRIVKDGLFVCAGMLIGYTSGMIMHYQDQFTRYKLIQPIIQRLDGEQAHRLAVWTASLPKSVRNVLGLCQGNVRFDRLEVMIKGIEGVIKSPVGLAAGFDKHAECMQGMLDLGLGFVEIGSVTPLPQEGNPKPRVWRLKNAVVNRYGFNSEGHSVVAQRLKEYRANGGKGPIGVNLGKNKNSSDGPDDFVAGVFALGEFADYLVVNVSSPNTPNLRDLQKMNALKELLHKVKDARDTLTNKPPLFVKIAPDLTDKELEDIISVVLDERIDGIIISNTTIARPNGIGEGLPGGLSGAPLFEPSTRMLRKAYRLCGNRVILIGAGGVFTGRDAFEKIRSGASLVQIYSSLAIHGPDLVEKINSELNQLVIASGFSNVSEAIGVDCR